MHLLIYLNVKLFSVYLPSRHIAARRHGAAKMKLSN